MIVTSSNLNQAFYCGQCAKNLEQINVWWKDGRNDDGQGYSEVVAECPSCHSRLLQKDGYGEIDSLEEALQVLQN